MRAWALAAVGFLLFPFAAGAAPSRSGLRLVALTNGTLQGAAWTLEAGPGKSKADCVVVTVNGSEATGGCEHLPPNGLFIYAGSSRAPAFVAGFVASTARRVEITFANGANSAAHPLTLPGGRLTGVAFFAAQAPCHTYPTGAEAYAKDGRKMADFTPPQTAAWRELEYASCWNPSKSPPPLHPGIHSYLQLDPGVEVDCLTPAGRIVAHVPKRPGDSYAQLRQPNGAKDILMVFQTHQSCFAQP